MSNITEIKTKFSEIDRDIEILTEEILKEFLSHKVERNDILITLEKKVLNLKEQYGLLEEKAMGRAEAVSSASHQ